MTKRARFTEEQIIGALKEREAGAKTADFGFPIDSEGLETALIAAG